MQSPSTFLLHFSQWNVDVARDRSEADKVLLVHFKKSVTAHETIAEILWKKSCHNDMPYSQIIANLERDGNTECRTAAKHISELYSAYIHQFKVKSAEFFRKQKDVDKFFCLITPHQAFEIPQWKEDVSGHAYEAHNKQLQQIAEALDSLIENSKESYKELVVKQEAQATGRIKDTEWTLNCPTPGDLQTAASLILSAMNANIPLAQSRHSIDEEIQQIVSLELLAWDSVLRSMKRFAQDVMYVPPIPSTYDHVEQTRRLIQDELEQFGLLRKCTLKQEAEKALVEEIERLNTLINNNPEQDIQLMKQYQQQYQLYLNSQQEARWVNLQKDHENDLLGFYRHLRAMRKEKLTKVSAELLSELETKSETRLQMLQNSHSSSVVVVDDDDYSRLEEECHTQLKQEDAHNRLKELYTRLLQMIRESKAGYIRGDPWLENTKQALDTFERKTAQDLGRDFCFCYLLNHDKIVAIHTNFSTESRRLAQQLVAKADSYRMAVEKSQNNIKLHNEQLRIRGGAFELITEQTFYSRLPTVAQAKVPPMWLKRYVMVLELESFATQRLFDPKQRQQQQQGGSKRARSESKEPAEVLEVSDEIAKDCQSNLYHRIIETASTLGRDKIEFWPLFDFAQRFHLLLLRVN